MTTVTLSVDIYGLQDAKDNGLGAVFEWTQTNGTTSKDLTLDRVEIDYPVPSVSIGHLHRYRLT